MSARLAVLPDFREEHWPSMDLCADQLLAHLPTATRIDPSYRRLLSRVPRLGGHGVNCDRLANRFITYPLHLRRVRSKYDLFHIVDHSYAQLVHALPAGRVGVQCHDLDAFRSLLDPAREPRPRWFRAMARRVLSGLQKAAIVFPISLATRDALVRHGLVDPAKLVHAPLGVAAEFTASDRAAPPHCSARIAGRPWVLHVGSCIPRKRIDALLGVVAAAKRTIPDLLLVKVGGEWAPQQQEQIAALALDRSIIHLKDLTRSELADIYRAAPLVLIPSEAEGFGLPAVEALACGAAVLASDIPALREAGGSVAEYAPVGDVETWSGHLIRLLGAGTSAKADRLGWAAQFTWERHAATIHAAYQKLLG